ncbi:MAG: hypothetical protein JWQ32_838 [Marmoricola sp.]|nr:hypothetical protein [Marmoricola sp.]
MSDQQPPAPPPPSYGNGGYPPFQSEPPPTGQAIAALVLGIAGLSLCPGVASIPAWIVGRSAMREIDASAGRLGGRTLAFVGYVLGIVGTALAGLGALVLAVFLVLALAFTSHVTRCDQSFDPGTGSMTRTC